MAKYNFLLYYTTNNDKIYEKGGKNMDDLRRMKKDYIFIFLTTLFTIFSSLFYLIGFYNNLTMFIVSIVILVVAVIFSIFRFLILFQYSNYSIANSIFSSAIMLICNASFFAFSLFLIKDSYPHYGYVITALFILILALLYLLINNLRLRKRYHKLRFEAFKK